MSGYQEPGKTPTTPKQDFPKQNHPLQKKENGSSDNAPSKGVSFTPEETPLSQTFARLGENPPDDGFSKVRQLMKNPPDDGFSRSREAVKNYNARNAARPMSERFSSVVPTAQGAIQRMQDSGIKVKEEEKLQLKKEGSETPTTEEPIKKIDPTQEKQVQEPTEKSADLLTANLPLTGSVGKGGINQQADVIQVQQLLAGLGLLESTDVLKATPAAEITEATLTTTIAGITKFQREVLHWNKADGNIGGAESTTLKKLKTVDADYVIEKMAAYPAIAAKRKAKAAAKAEKEKQESIASAQAEKAKQIEAAQIKKLKNEPATPENAQRLIASYPDTAALAEALREYTSYNPKLVISVLEETGYMSQDDLAFNIVSQTNDLSGLSKPLLQRLKVELDAGWTGEAEYEQIARIDKVLGGKVEEKEAAKEIKEEVKGAVETTPYASQLDNKFDETKVYGDKSSKSRVNKNSTCNVTSLAMALRELAPKEEVRATLLDQLEKGGYCESELEPIKDYDIEDLIMHRFMQLGADYWLEGTRKEFGKSSFTFSSDPPHKYAYCLTEMGKLIVKGLKMVRVARMDNNKTEKVIAEHFTNKVKPGLDQGTKVIMGTHLTSGHVVYLEAVKEEGIIIQDPYGLNIGQKSKYLKNGKTLNNTELERLKSNLDDSIKTRLKYKTATYNALKKLKQEGTGTLPENAGEMNFYTWAEVKKLNIGRWMTGLNKKE